MKGVGARLQPEAAIYTDTCSQTHQNDGGGSRMGHRTACGSSPERSKEREGKDERQKKDRVT